MLQTRMREKYSQGNVTEEERYAHLDAGFFEMVYKFFDVDFGIQLIRKWFIAFPKTTFRWIAALNGAFDDVSQSRPFHTLRERRFRRTPRGLFTRNTHDGRMTPIRVLHVVAEFVTGSFDAQRTATGDTDMKNKVIPIRGRREGVLDWGENGGTRMETRHDGQHIIVCDGHIEGGYVDLAVDGRLRGDGDGWGRISWVVVCYLICWHLDVHDGVVEGLHG